MDEYERHWIRLRRTGVQKVHVGPINVGGELRVLVDSDLPRAPVVPFAPVGDQPPDEGIRDAVPLVAAARLWRRAGLSSRSRRSANWLSGTSTRNGRSSSPSTVMCSLMFTASLVKVTVGLLNKAHRSLYPLGVCPCSSPSRQTCQTSRPGPVALAPPPSRRPHEQRRPYPYTSDMVTSPVPPVVLRNSTGINGPGINGTGINGTGINGIGINGTGTNGIGINGIGINGIGIEDPLEVVLGFLRGHRRFDVAEPSRSASFGELDLKLANRGGARISAAETARILERRPSIERTLQTIAPDASLARAANAVPWMPMRQLFDAFADIRGVGFSKMTKALHPKRPALVPMLDSVVQKYLEDDDLGSQAPFGERALGLVCGYKRDLDRNRAAVRALRQQLARRGYELTEVRILDFLIWSVKART